MLLFPLGLKARTRQFPIATVLITAATVVLSVLQFPKLHSYEKDFFKRVGGLFQARAELLVKNCEQTEFTPEQCDFIEKNLKHEKPESIALEFGRLAMEAQKQLGKKDGSKTAQQLKDYLLEDDKWDKRSTQLDGNPAFVAYQAAKQEYRDEMLAVQSQGKLLSRGNVSMMTVIIAQWTHGGWMHLLGNMVLFVLLAIPVEQRLGSLFFTVLYMLGGTIGLGGQIFMYSDPVKYLVGASANVSAVAGAFFILFWSLEMRVWLSALFLYNRVVFVPTWVFVPIFLVLGDVTGVMTPESGVAHAAHLFGFATGAALAFVHSVQFPLPKGFAFDFEYLLTERAYSTNEPMTKLKLLWELLFYNPDNREAQEASVSIVLQLSEKSWAKLPGEARLVINRHLPALLSAHIADRELNSFFSVANLIPADWPWVQLLKKANPSQLRHAAEAAEARGKYRLALQLYEVYLKRVSNVSARRLVQPVVDELKLKVNDEASAA